MKKLKLFLMTLCASVLCVFFNSCGEDSVEKDEYYIVLDEVLSNLADEHNNMLCQEIFDTFKFSNGEKYVSLGASTEIPYEVFEEQCDNLRTSLRQAWADKIPAGGYVDYIFSLRMNSPNGASCDSNRISIRN